MQDFDDKLSLVRAFLEAAPKWNTNAQRSGSRAMFWLCDQLLQDVEDRSKKPDPATYLSGKLRTLKAYFDEWSHSGHIDFESIEDCYKGLMLLGDVPDATPE